MLPSSELFESEVRALGVGRDSEIVVYDRNGMFSSPRAWWMFRAMGHKKVSVLNGGFEAWQKAGCEVSVELSKVQEGDFVANLQKEAFIDSSQVLNHLKSDEQVVLDARSKDRFDEAHMPGALNLPYTELLEDGEMKQSMRS